MSLNALPDDSTDLTTTIEAEIRAGGLPLPMLPNVAAEVIASSIDEQADAARLAALIQRDQSLASHLLRVANSAAFRASTEIVSLQQAIARLGMLRIREIAVSVALKGTLFQPGPYRAVTEAIWRESLATGLWAREIARTSRKAVEIAYLCGLLHRIGAPVVLHRLGELDSTLQPQAVQAVLARLAPLAGEQLAAHWALPDPICASITHFEAPAAAGSHAALVAIANLGAAFACWSASGDLEPEPPMEHPLARADAPAASAAAEDRCRALTTLPAAALLNLYPDDIEALANQRAAIDGVLAAMIL